MQKQQSHSQTNSSQPQRQYALQMNRTVQGVAAAFYGIIRRTHALELPALTVQTLDSQFSIFNNSKLVGDRPATVQDHIKAPQPDFLHIYKFIYSLFRRAQIEPECLIAAIAYFEKFMTAVGSSRLLLTALNWERLVFTLMMIASKAWDDVSCSTKSFSICSSGTISLSDLCIMERIILYFLDFRLYLTADTYRVVYYDLKKFWMNMTITDRGSILPTPKSLVDSLDIPERWGPSYVFFCDPFSSLTPNENHQADSASLVTSTAQINKTPEDSSQPIISVKSQQQQSKTASSDPKSKPNPDCSSQIPTILISTAAPSTARDSDRFPSPIKVGCSRES